MDNWTPELWDKISGAIMRSLPGDAEEVARRMERGLTVFTRVSIDGGVEIIEPVEYYIDPRDRGSLTTP